MSADAAPPPTGESKAPSKLAKALRKAGRDARKSLEDIADRREVYKAEFVEDRQNAERKRREHNLDKTAYADLHRSVVCERIVREEHAEINKRREFLRGKKYSDGAPVRVAGAVRECPPTPQYVHEGEKTKDAAQEASSRQLLPMYDTNGLAMSGGGIRSAAFCMGVMQALSEYKKIGQVDYVSSVSGGGFFACSMCAAMSLDGSFPFGKRSLEEKDRAVDNIRDTPQTGHIRNYSNYLIPAGFSDVLLDVLIVLRGWVVSLILILSGVFTALFFTLLFNPSKESLRESVFGEAFGLILDSLPLMSGFATSYKNSPFPITVFLLYLLFILCVVWTLHRSWSRKSGQDIPSKAGSLGLILLLAALSSFFVELQPYLIARINDQSVGLVRWITDNVKSISGVFAALGGVGVFVRTFLLDKIKEEAKDPGVKQILAKYSRAALFVLSGIAIPALIWLFYLSTAHCLISGSGSAGGYCKLVHETMTSINGNAVIMGVKSYYLYLVFFLLIATCANFVWKCAFAFVEDGGTGNEQHVNRGIAIAVVGLILLTVFLIALSELVSTLATSQASPWLATIAIVSVASLVFVLNVNPNSTSLNRLYRDRLSKAFLFDPADFKKVPVQEGKDEPGVSKLKMSKLNLSRVPLLIVNAALNIQGSKYVNKRGRNAEFFTFTPLRTGSHATDFAKTEDMEAADKRLDLATIMAISGAAFSSNMGSKTIRPLAPALTILNLRLGYWLRNPADVRNPTPGAALSRLLNFFIIKEMLGRLHENSGEVYLTDGGHIDNLGLYALLYRRCRCIIVIDAEADPKMTFASFVEVQRHARIDLGVRISLPWQSIRDGHTALDKKFETGDLSSKPVAPMAHAALGEIHYPGGQVGKLLYIKSSLTGDESDYVLDYKRRNLAFPHETTGDQFFTEEQFEAYRALGFHVGAAVFSNKGGEVIVSKIGNFAAFTNEFA